MKIKFGKGTEVKESNVGKNYFRREREQLTENITSELRLERSEDMN